MIELYRILLDAVFCLLITSIMTWHPILFDDFDYFKMRNNHFLECPCCQINSLDKKQRFTSALRKVEVKNCKLIVIMNHTVLQSMDQEARICKSKGGQIC
jgi:hypothetical protein